ncbi:TPA: hypothetical protein HA219_03560 [Candidatus Woesearchaeota archaeon]|nr:hypothetical protein [uncultured archaeon]AQS32028.1 hypothetical protein [uncultured archaeon]MBS3115221.1 hypothetical protein [Candidatus Woesearchaeota archaeon]HIH39771.1 hypothetical protein [Candidatus Woesearchaeota archaeon]
MAKLTAWIMTIIGALLLVQAGNWLPALTVYNPWLIGLGWLVAGIAKIQRAR